jgi:hypothetical protein
MGKNQDPGSGINIRNTAYWIRIGIQPKMLDPDPDLYPYQINTDKTLVSRFNLKL